MNDSDIRATVCRINHDRPDPDLQQVGDPVRGRGSAGAAEGPHPARAPDRRRGDGAGRLYPRALLGDGSRQFRIRLSGGRRDSDRIWSGGRFKGAGLQVEIPGAAPGRPGHRLLRRCPDHLSGEPAAGGCPIGGLVFRRPDAGGDRRRHERDQPRRRPGRPRRGHLPAGLLLHRLFCVSGRRQCRFSPFAGPGRGDIRISEIQHLSGQRLHGRHRKPAPGLYGHRPCREDHAGEHQPVPHTPFDHPGIPHFGHPDRHGGEDQTRTIPLLSRQEPLSPPADQSRLLTIRRRCSSST